MTRRILALFLGTTGALRAQPAVGVVETPGTARLLRQGTQLELTLQAGDLLFPGDRVSVDAGSALLWHCPSLQSLRLDAGAGVRIESQRVTAVAGQITSRTALLFCPVPAIDRSQLARPVQFGLNTSRYRGMSAGPDARASLAPAVLARLDAELQSIASAPDSSQPMKDAARAAVLARYGLHSEAAEAYGRLSAEWGAVDWPRRLLHDEREALSRGESVGPAIGGTGKTFALLVGINEYLELPPGQHLHYAEQDATAVYQFLRSSRGGSVPEENIRLLRNRDATVAVINANINDFLRARATRQDTVIVFIAAHGVVSDGAYLVAYDTKPEDLRDSAIDMAKIQAMLQNEFQNVGRVVLFVDVCRAGVIGNIPNENMTPVLEALARLKGRETYALMASGPDESSVESERFGGGHGAFSYFLLRGLGGDADENGNHQVDADELQDYVRLLVRQSTGNKQHPRMTGSMPGTRVLTTDVTLPGIELAGWRPEGRTDIASMRALDAPRDASWFVPPPSLASADVQSFEQAIAAGRLLPPEPENAADILGRLSRTLAQSPLDLLLFENRLRTALEDRGQEVLLRYLRGEDVPQRQEDFERGANWFEGALQLDPESQALQSRSWFCRARAMLFQNRLDEARVLLERAARVEPEGPYLYNALGLLYLQQAAYPRALAAFREAVRLAPYWPYSRHNLALALTQTGAYQGAIGAYREAGRIAPNAWYIPYNLGLVQQRVNLLREAEKSFREAAALAPSRPEPVTALGYLAAYRGRSREAERFYREALAGQPLFLPARHNLALLLSRTGHADDAMALWEGILRDDPDFLASRLALAAMLERSGRGDQAVAQFDEALLRDPGLTAARLARARLWVASKKWVEAESDMRLLITVQPANPAAWEILGDTLAAQARNSEARDAYAAGERTAGGELRTALRKKMVQLRKTKP